MIYLLRDKISSKGLNLSTPGEEELKSCGSAIPVSRVRVVGVGGGAGGS